MNKYNLNKKRNDAGKSKQDDFLILPLNVHLLS